MNRSVMLVERFGGLLEGFEVILELLIVLGQLGAEKSQLGLPTSGEYDVSGGRKNDFQFGSITWKASARR